jgi:PAS domain S-box-containing protein
MTDDLCQTTFSKDYVNNIIDNMNDALFVIDKELRIVTINRATSLLIKYTESEILKYSIKDFLISEESGAKIFKEKIFNGEGIENLELTLQDKEGSSIPVSISGSPLKDADGKVIRVVLIARDISEHKRLLSELSEARSELEEKVKKLEKSDRAMLFMVEDLNKTTEDLKVARNKLEEKIIEVEKVNKELDDFTYIVSHDLKEPLRGIKAFTKMLSEDYSGKVDKEGKEYLSNISDSSVRMARLIEDLLNLSRIGRIRNIEPGVDLNEALSDVRKNLAYSLEEKNVDLKIGKDFPKITCDKIRISEVFSNLISNAIKYSKKDARPIVEVGYSKKGDFYEFYVKDNGIGIEEGYYDKIFQIFQRLHGKGEYEGTGAGLTIVKKIIESHNGKVWVESKVGEGSIFYFTLPVSQEKMITEI